MSDNATPRLLTTDEVAELAGCSADTVLRAIKADEIKGYRVGKSYAVPQQEATRWAEQYKPYAGLRRKEEDDP